MYSIDGMNISMPQGDSAIIPFIFYTENEGTESPYILKNGQYALLSLTGCKGAPTALSVRVNADVQTEDGTCYFEITPEMSARVPRGEYFYTLSLHNSDDTEVDTWVGFPENATFEVR